MVRPHVAIITTVEPVHIEFFASVEEIADAKAEIFDGLMPGGVGHPAATIRISTGWRPRPSAWARASWPSAPSDGAWARLIDCQVAPDGNAGDGGDRRQAAALSHGGAGPASGR